MHNNYFFLKRLKDALKPKLTGLYVQSCFSQEKDELLIEFGFKTQAFFIRASLQPTVAQLSFPATYNRSRRNNVDLFPEIINKKVVDIIQIENDRSFYLQLDDNLNLFFKMHGNRSNVIVFEGKEPVNIFLNHLENDLITQLDQYAKVIDLSFASLKFQNFNLRDFLPTLDKSLIVRLKMQGYEEKSEIEKYALIQTLLHELQTSDFYIENKNSKPVFSLVPVSNPIFETDDPINAVNELGNFVHSLFTFSREKEKAIKKLEGRKGNIESYISKNQQKLLELENSLGYEQQANILMANLHQIPEKTERIRLFNFYNDSEIEIKLKKDLSPQKNAEVYYKKSKNQKTEYEFLLKNIIGKETELATLNLKIDKLRGIENFKTLRNFLKLENSTVKTNSELPSFKETFFMGFKILIGKNAENNDLLLKASHNEDLWLHARDVSGSHVIIKHRSGYPFPKEVLEKAAGLAAFYSKRKNDTLCPVIFTPRKHVRKVKGADPGQVKVEKEKVIMIEPQSLVAS